MSGWSCKVVNVAWFSQCLFCGATIAANACGLDWLALVHHGSCRR